MQPEHPLRAHHQRTIDRLVERFGEDPRYPALLVGGSVAKGLAADDSDVDVLFVVTPEAWEHCCATGEYMYYATDLCDYPGGYVDGKYLTLEFLQEVADHGSEPARWAFTGVFPAYSRLPDLEALLARIPVYPEADQKRRMDAFYSQAMVWTGFLGEAEKRRDHYLLNRAASELVLFGARLILAYNKQLYPYHKWLMTILRQVPQKPENLVALAEQLLAQPSTAHGRAFWDCLNTYRDWGVSVSQAFSTFVELSEWNWRNGAPPVADW